MQRPREAEKVRPDGGETERQRLELELLVVRCQLGERDALDALVERWHPALWRYVRSMTGDPSVAEEVLQEGWFRILRGIDRLREPASIQAWLYSVVRRTFVDRLRQRYADAAVEALESEPVDAEPPPELGWEESERLHHALQRLSPAHRETIVLFYLRELDLQEVAAVLGVPVGTVKSRLHRGRQLLREELETQGVTR